MNSRIFVFISFTLMCLFFGQAFDDFGDLDNIDEDQSFLEADNKKDRGSKESFGEFQALESEIKKESWAPIKEQKKKKRKKKKMNWADDDSRWLEQGDEFEETDNALIPDIDKISISDLKLKDIPGKDKKEEAVLTKNPEIDIKIKALSAQIEKKPGDIRSRVFLGRIYLSRKLNNETIKILDPYNSELNYLGLAVLSRAFKEKKDYLNEIRILKILVANSPESYKAHLQLAKAYQNQGDLNKAVASLRKSIELNPSYERSYNLLYTLFRDQKNIYESQIIVKDMIKKFGRKAIYVRYLCELYVEDAFLEQAIKHCKEAIGKEPEYAKSHAHLAQSYLDKGDVESAEKIFKTASRQFKGSEYVLRKTADFYFAKKSFGVASRYYSMAVLADNSSYEAQIGMANSTMKIGKVEQALIGFENACKLDKKRALPSFKSATAKMRLEKNREWERKFNRSMFSCR